MERAAPDFRGRVGVVPVDDVFFITHLSRARLLSRAMGCGAFLGIPSSSVDDRREHCVDM
jgi:hypothetical protein